MMDSKYICRYINLNEKSFNNNLRKKKNVWMHYYIYLENPINVALI